MQIIAISPSRLSNQVWLKFDDQSFIPFKIDDVVKLKLKKFTELGDDLHQQIITASVHHLLSEYCLRQIAISPKVELVLRQKLRLYCQKISQKYNFTTSILKSESEAIISNIKSSGLLDENQYVEYLVKRNPKKSIAELNYKLKTLGINYTINLSPSDELTKVKDLLAKKFKNSNLADYNTKNKVMSSLFRKGFAISIIKTAIDEHLKVR